MDTQKELFVWIGNDTTHDERKNAIIYAHVSKKYCMGNKENKYTFQFAVFVLINR